MRALAQVPELAELGLPFIGRLFGPTSLDLRTKEIVVLRVSARNECRYCIQTHTVAAWDAGLTAAEAAGLAAEGPAPASMSERERALIDYCDAICEQGPPGRALERLRDHFPEHELVELTMLAAATVMLNRFCTALELPTSPQTLTRLEEAE